MKAPLFSARRAATPFLLSLAASLLLAPLARAQAAAPIIEGNSSSASAQPQLQSNLVDVTPTIVKRPGEFSTKPFSSFAIAGSVSSQGIGAEAAVPLSRSFNLRGGTDFFDYSTTLTQDNIPYAPSIDLMSSHVVLDWYPFHGHFRVSGGYMFMNGSSVNATAVMAGGQSFTANNVTYYSSATNPLSGGANVNWPTSGPRFTIGWGNMIPRTHSHISVPTEIGFVYFGQVNSSLSFKGNVCTDSALKNCYDATTYGPFNTNLAADKATLQNDINDYARFYPILKIGLSVKF
jgi:hypothetical protein